jgi:RimJ/RimL family protein N-acetyltransferase
MVTLQTPQPSDAERIVEERDAESFRWFGPGGGNPSPTACIWVDGELVGWVDYDRDDDHDWLQPGEVNVGYCVFPAARGKGYAARAVELLLRHLAESTEHEVATLLIHPENTRSPASSASSRRARSTGSPSSGATSVRLQAWPPSQKS